MKCEKCMIPKWNYNKIIYLFDGHIQIHQHTRPAKKISISDYPICVCGNNAWLKVDIYLKCSACGMLCIVSGGLDDELESERILNKM